MARPLAEWHLPSSVTLGSSVRARGIEREIRRRLPWSTRKSLTVETGKVVLHMPDAEAAEFDALSAIVGDVLPEFATLPILPSEAEDILSISSRERHKWLDDGCLQSAGTKTVKLRGRAKAVTFHVFTPGFIEHVLDTGLPEIWREEDIVTAAENRRRAAGKAALTRAGKRSAKSRKAAPDPDEQETGLDGWEEFEAEGLLR
ncbi:hypothetical protein AB4Z10_15515 [Bosea sp. RAF48]|uniref:hypothetical protein n=1 Tax=Bosea sp. RAF48 TaxID=3237480 RepID=UPI003F8FF554